MNPLTPTIAGIKLEREYSTIKLPSMNPMATGGIVAEVISLAFSLVLTLWLKTASKLKRPGWFLLYVLSINTLALITAFAVDKIVVLLRQ